MNKVIIGIAGDKGAGKTTAVDVFSQYGFYKVSIMDKVEEFASYLFSKDTLNNDKEAICDQIRKKGISTCKSYWINLVLTSIPDNENMIVIDDIEESEVGHSPIELIEIFRPSVSKGKVYQGTIIENNGSLKEFIAKVKSFIANNFDKK